MAGKKNYELEIVISGGTDASLAASVRKARQNINTLERQAGLSARSIGESFGGLSVAGINSLGKISDQVFGVMAKGGKLAALGTAGILGASTVVGASFESQMSTVGAISQANATDMKILNELAKDMGRTTKFSATEAGQGLEFMAMAGWKTQDMVGGLPGIMSLAAASGEGLALTSDIVTDAMTAFGMQANEAAQFADVLAQASSNSNTNVAMMGETFKYVAPVAGSFGYTIEDVAIATGLMANAGVKGSQAGTAMRSLFNNLAKPTKEVLGYMDKLSVSLDDGTGQMKPFREQLITIRDGFNKLSSVQKSEYSSGLAGKYGMSGLLAVVNATEKDFEDLLEAVDNSAGSAQRMSEVRMDNLIGDFTLLKSAAEGAGIEIYGGFSDSLRSITQLSTDWVTSFTGKIIEDMPTIQRQVKQFGRGIAEGFEPILDFGEWCMDNPDVIKGTLAGIVTAFGVFKLPQVGLNTLKSLSTLITAWPVAAFGVAVGAIAGIVVAVKENNKQLKKADMASRFGDITLSMEELDETARLIIDNGNMGKAAKAVAAMGEVKDLAKGFEEANKTLNRLNWKVGMGFTLTDEDTGDYKASIDQMVNGALELVEQSQYTAQISVNAIFGENSFKGQSLINGFNRTYSAINDEVQALGKQLGDVYSAALEDGIIDIDETKTVQELQEKLAELTQMVSQSQSKAKYERIMMEYSGKDLDPDAFMNLQEEISAAIAEEKEALRQSTDLTLGAVYMDAERNNRSPEWVETKEKEINTAFQQQSSELDMRGVKFSKRSIADTYQDVLDPGVPKVIESFDDSMETLMQNMQNKGGEIMPLSSWIDPEMVKNGMRFKGIDETERDGIIDTWTGVKTEYESMLATARSAWENGMELPEGFTTELSEMTAIGAIAGDENAITHLMGLSIAENPEYQETIRTMGEMGEGIPEEIAVYMEKGDAILVDQCNDMVNVVKSTLENGFGSMTVDGTVDVILKANIGIPGSKANIYGIQREGVSIEGDSDGEPAHNAKGGLIQSPTLSWFAEESPEMAIPLNGSGRSMELWRQTGEMLGVTKAYDFESMYQDLAAADAIENNNSSSFAPVFSPVINITSGSGTEEQQLYAGLSAGYERFVEFMEKYRREQYRVSF